MKADWLEQRADEYIYMARFLIAECFGELRPVYDISLVKQPDRGLCSFMCVQLKPKIASIPNQISVIVGYSLYTRPDLTKAAIAREIVRYLSEVAADERKEYC